MALLLLGLALGIGLLLGLLGGGGSILSVPLLHYIGGHDAREAIAGSLLVVGVTSAWAALLHARAGRVNFRTVSVFGAAGMAGALIGGQLSALLPPALLVIAFAGVMIAAATAMLRRINPDRLAATSRAQLPLGRILLVGVGVGILAGLVGAGGGFLIVPALIALGLPMAQAVGTSLAVISLQSLAGFASHAEHVELDWPVLLGVTASAVMGSILGQRAVARVPVQLLRRGFALFVLATAAAMLFGEIPDEVRASLPWGWILFAAGATGFIGWGVGRLRRSRMVQRPGLTVRAVKDRASSITPTARR